MKRLFVFVAVFGLACVFSCPTGAGQAQPSASNKSRPTTTDAVARSAAAKVCVACVRAHMEFLAADALRGRGSGTADELVAATYVASELRAYGIAPAGDDDGYIQRAVLQESKLNAPPKLTIAKPGSSGDASALVYGKDFIVLGLMQAHFSGPLHAIRVGEGDPQASGSVVLILGNDRNKLRAKALSLGSEGAVAAIFTASAERSAKFAQKSRDLPELPTKVDGQDAEVPYNLNVLEVSPDAAKTLEALPEGSTVSFEGTATSETKYTWNALGILHGSDPNLQHSAVLLSAHLDHLGVGQPVNGDDIYNGADDDASGTTAVLELARVLGKGPKPKRTVIFALFGSEETGALGSQYFRLHPPVPLKQIAVNLEFEMLGRADPLVKSDTMWLTGWERSNLGPTLAAHGANLVGDPHPEQNFFARSDNYGLAKTGVVAQTVSSYGLHKDYHQPSDDLAHIDFKHMDAAIQSLLEPVTWLVNSSFTPNWNEGGRP